MSEGSEFIGLEKQRWTKGFTSKMRDTKHCVCRRAKLPGRGVHSEKARETGRRRVREETIADSSQFVAYSGLDR